ncbi:glycosyltransferase [Amphritea atlantica]|uniref:Glycosyltransferase n=1 Tax=Amphritea atlantica TaxID=355243 RepID=A0ABY5GUA4_9GAMM|nr:glycosyltransferase [Amphritea atlantica]
MSNKLPKILHVLEGLGGGTLTSSSQICNLMVEAGCEVHLIYSPLRDELPENWMDFFSKKIVLHRIDMKRSISPASDLKSLIKILCEYRNIRPDVIHLHCSKAGFIGRIAAMFFPSAKVFYSPRGFGFLQENISSFSKKVYWILEWLASRISGTIIACSYSELEEANKIHSRSILIENAIDVTKVPKKVSNDNSKVKVGTLGRISYQKNPYLFFEVAQYFSSNADIEFIWIGGGDQEMQDLLERQGVTVSGWLEREEAINALTGLDIYLQTSLWEGMPLSVIEASLSGIPAVVTNVIGNRDVVENGVTGYICDDKFAIAEAIERLLLDKGHREKLGDESRSKGLGRFSMERLLSDYSKVYGLNR